MTKDEPEAVWRGREALRRPVADYADPGQEWRLDVQCAGSCPVQDRLVAELVWVVPISLTWVEVVPRMRCGRCGEPVAIAGLSGPPETPSAGVSWLLLYGTGQWRWRHRCLAKSHLRLKREYPNPLPP